MLLSGTLKAISARQRFSGLSFLFSKLHAVQVLFPVPAGSLSVLLTFVCCKYVNVRRSFTHPVQLDTS